MSLRPLAEVLVSAEDLVGRLAALPGDARVKAMQASGLLGTLAHEIEQPELERLGAGPGFGARLDPCEGQLLRWGHQLASYLDEHEGELLARWPAVLRIGRECVNLFAAAAAEQRADEERAAAQLLELLDHMRECVTADAQVRQLALRRAVVEWWRELQRRRGENV